MTKTELMQAIYRLTHGTGVVYRIIYEDLDEGTTAFREKRDAQFKGR